MDPKVFVRKQDQATPIIKFPSGVSGRELLENVHDDPKFGPGKVTDDEGVVVIQAILPLPDGNYTFVPKQSGKPPLLQTADIFGKYV